VSNETISEEKNNRKPRIEHASMSIEALKPTSQLYRSGIKNDRINESRGKNKIDPSITSDVEIFCTVNLLIQ
jgi:hypothetical protein